MLIDAYPGSLEAGPVNREGGEARRLLTARPPQSDCYARPAQSDCYGGHRGQAKSSKKRREAEGGSSFAAAAMEDRADNSEKGHGGKENG